MPVVTDPQRPCDRHNEWPPSSQGHAVVSLALALAREEGFWKQVAYPRSRTNREIQHLSRPLSSNMPRSDLGSTSGCPSIVKAAFGSRHSPRGSSSRGPGPSISCDIRTLCIKRSIAIVVAIDMYRHVSSSVLSCPGNIHGTLTMKARTISTERYPCITTCFASLLVWLDRRLDKAESCKKRAEAAMMEVVRKEERERVKAKLYIRGSRPHRVWARLP